MEDACRSGRGRNSEGEGQGEESEGVLTSARVEHGGQRTPAASREDPAWLPHACIGARAGVAGAMGNDAEAASQAAPPRLEPEPSAPPSRLGFVRGGEERRSREPPPPPSGVSSVGVRGGVARPSVRKRGEGCSGWGVR